PARLRVENSHIAREADVLSDKRGLQGHALRIALKARCSEGVSTGRKDGPRGRSIALGIHAVSEPIQDRSAGDILASRGSQRKRFGDSVVSPHAEKVKPIREHE